MKFVVAFFFFSLALLAIPCTGLQLDESKPHKSKSGKKKPLTQRQKAHKFFRKEPPPPAPPAVLNVDNHTSFFTFTHQLVTELRKRPFGRGSLEHFLTKIADAKLASTGEWVEFGSATGSTITRIVKRRKELGSTQPVHGFDSFQGLPQTWRNSSLGDVNFQKKWLERGSLDRHGQPPFDDPSSVQWHVGWFNETVPAFAKDVKSLATGSITFANMDANLYSSTAEILQALEHRLAPGAYVLFNSLIGYPEYQNHEMKSLYEMLKRTGRALKVIGYPGPLLIEFPDNLKVGLSLQKGERQSIPQNALLQLM